MKYSSQHTEKKKQNPRTTHFTILVSQGVKSNQIFHHRNTVKELGSVENETEMLL